MSAVDETLLPTNWTQRMITPVKPDGHGVQVGTGLFLSGAGRERVLAAGALKRSGYALVFARRHRRRRPTSEAGSAPTRYEAADRPYFEAKLKELCPNCDIIYSNANQDANAQLSQAEAALTNGLETAWAIVAANKVATL
jgi:hypothetical protein